eukprot:GHUV01031275.1.p1 GENE.GHUV01031275.1~~GHUV01031275.1.p1  ORF type:complete len:104 (-),score=6.83 GHUV01031275.1:237-548(-)
MPARKWPLVGGQLRETCIQNHMRMKRLPKNMHSIVLSMITTMQTTVNPHVACMPWGPQNAAQPFPLAMTYNCNRSDSYKTSIAADYSALLSGFLGHTQDIYTL